MFAPCIINHNRETNYWLARSFVLCVKNMYFTSVITGSHNLYLFDLTLQKHFDKKVKFALVLQFKLGRKM